MTGDHRGIVVHGTHTVRVAPDTAALEFAVTRLKDNPSEAIRAANAAARAVRDFLVAEEVPAADIGASRVTLKQDRIYKNGEHMLRGYLAQVSFRVVTTQLDQVESLLVGVIDAGADLISGVTFMSSLARDARDEARHGAIHAARRKAALYAGAAHARLGKVLAIEDQNPNRIRERERGGGGDEPVVNAVGAYDPGSLEISAAVVVTFDLET